MNNCIEVAAIDNGRAVRDSKHPSGPALRFTAAEWSAFTTGVKAGELDWTPHIDAPYRGTEWINAQF